MDLNALMGTLLSQDSLQNMSSLTGASSENVASVLSSALPAMLSGAQGQANDENALAGFAGALQDHAKDDTSDIASFLSGVDLEDGGKIVAHLLGGNQAQPQQDLHAGFPADRHGPGLPGRGDLRGLGLGYGGPAAGADGDHQRAGDPDPDPPRPGGSEGLRGPEARRQGPGLQGRGQRRTGHGFLAGLSPFPPQSSCAGREIAL